MGYRPPPPLYNLISPLLTLFLFLSLPSIALSVTVTTLLSPYPHLSAFSRLLAATNVAGDLLDRSSLTLLAVPNSVLLSGSFSGADGDALGAAASDIADVLRYHVLLQYLSSADLRRVPPEGELVATLYQATGRAAGELGSVNITRAGGSVVVRAPVPYADSKGTITSHVTSVPYNISVFSVDSLVVPFGLDRATSEVQPPSGFLNITGVLSQAGDFNVMEWMLAGSGVATELERDEKGAGITVFAPTDEAFAALSQTERVQTLPADQKVELLRFHVLHSYYPLGSLEGIVNPVEPTLATEDSGAGRFTLNITRVNGSVSIGTGMVHAAITRTVFDQNPVAVFGISRVLLPREIFPGKGKAAIGSRVVAAAGPQTEVVGLIPEVDAPPSRLSSPPWLRGADGSGATGGSSFRGRVVALWCLEVLYLLLG